MENEIKLVSNVEGSVITDNVMESLDRRSAQMAEAGRKVGQLEGELEVAKQLLEQAIEEGEEKARKASEEVTVIVKSEGERVYDLYEGWIKTPDNIKKVITTQKTDLDKLANAAVKAQAAKDVEEAEKKVKVLEEKVEAAKKAQIRSEETAAKMVKEVTDSQKKQIELAIEKAERQNLRTIADLKLEVKSLHKEADLMVDEKNNLARERDLALEVVDAQLRMRDNLIEILERDTKTILGSIQKRIAYWNYNRKIKRLES
jgi:hypothetical protein